MFWPLYQISPGRYKVENVPRRNSKSDGNFLPDTHRGSAIAHCVPPHGQIADQQSREGPSPRHPLLTAPSKLRCEGSTKTTEKKEGVRNKKKERGLPQVVQWLRLCSV